MTSDQSPATCIYKIYKVLYITSKSMVYSTED